MKKRFFTSLLAMSVLLTGVTGCGGTKDSAPAVETSTNVYYEMSNTPSAINKAPSVVYSDECEGYYEGCYEGYEGIEFNTEEYNVIVENGFKKVSVSPLSTFSADVDTASYSNVRRFVDYGYALNDIPKGSVRTEEMINYFNYDYRLPEGNEPFGVTTEIGDCPWNEKSKLLSVGVKTEKIDFSDAAPSNIVFLIDVSGSMDEENKLPLLVKSFKILLENLGEKDRVSIVTYAGEDKVVLKGVSADKKEKIEDALDGLMAGGGTNGGKGIVTAYELAEKYFIKDGNNRVILATDGDLNIGVTSKSDLNDLIKKEAKSGVFLTVLGFGMGNYSDDRLESLADSGNGNYAYIDSLKEAKKVLCEELGANMVTVAKDVKFQVEFNPAVVAEYRLLGYEDRLLNDEDFEDDTKDAGEIGAGHTVTALYEIVTVDGYEGSSKNLKYQDSKLSSAATDTDEWLTVSVRYKEPDGDTSKLLEYPVSGKCYLEENSEDFRFAAVVAEFAQILRGETYVGDATLRDVLYKLEDVNLEDEYRKDFELMVMRLISNGDV